MSTPSKQQNPKKKKTTKNKSQFNQYLTTKFYPWLESVIGYQKKDDFSPIDFHQPWYKLFIPMWSVLLFNSVTNTIYFLMYTYWPLVIFWGVANNPKVILWYGLAHALSVLINVASGFAYSHSIQNLVTNFDVSVTQFFLTSDPINHSKKSSGQITSKASRAKSALEPLVSNISFNIVPAFIELGSISLGFFAINQFFGWYTSVFFVIFTLFLIGARTLLFSPILKWSFKYSDAFSSTALEILQQQNYIRTAMASDLMMSKFMVMARKVISVLTTRRNAQTLYNNGIRILWFVSLAGLILMFYSQNLFTSDNQIALGLLIAYIQNAGNINRIGGTITSLYELATNIDDLYDYIHEFGENTFPVITK